MNRIDFSKLVVLLGSGEESLKVGQSVGFHADRVTVFSGRGTETCFFHHGTTRVDVERKGLESYDLNVGESIINYNLRKDVPISTDRDDSQVNVPITLTPDAKIVISGISNMMY